MYLFVVTPVSTAARPHPPSRGIPFRKRVIRSAELYPFRVVNAYARIPFSANGHNTVAAGPFFDGGSTSNHNNNNNNSHGGYGNGHNHNGDYSDGEGYAAARILTLLTERIHQLIKVVLPFPILRQSLMAAHLFLLADIIAQSIEKAGQRAIASEFGIESAFNITRAASFFCYGMLFAGPVAYLWFRALDSIVRVVGMRGAVIKVVVDQIAYSPLATGVYYVFMAAFARDDIWQKVKNNYWSTLLTSWTVWPAVNLFNFAAVESSKRVLFMSAASVVWMTYLSMMSAGKKRVRSAIVNAR